MGGSIGREWGNGVDAPCGGMGCSLPGRNGSQSERSLPFGVLSKVYYDTFLLLLTTYERTLWCTFERVFFVHVELNVTR